MRQVEIEIAAERDRLRKINTDLVKALIEVRLLVPSGFEAMGIIDEACGKAGVEPWRCKVPATDNGRGK